MTSTIAPIPSTDALFELLPRLLTEPAEVFADLITRFGPVVRLRVEGLPMDLLLVNEPPLVREVLLDRADCLTKGAGLQAAKELLGEGLLTSEGDDHARQRRLVSTAFRQPQLRRFVEIFARRSASWADGLSDVGTIDLHAGFTSVALSIVGDTLFGMDLDAAAPAVKDSLEAVLAVFAARTPLGAALGETPDPASAARAETARQTLDELVLGIISRRRAEGEDGDDLISLLIGARDDDGDHLDDSEIRDQVMTLLLAGHETTANLLTWIAVELSANPGWARRIHEEVEQVTDGRPVTVHDLEHLTVTSQVINETLRLHPPAWAMTRMAPEGATIGGFEIPPGGQVLVSPWLLHRDERHWDTPQVWNPARWSASEAFERRRQMTFAPFGAGARSCIGEHFAQMEATVVLAELLRRRTISVVEPDKVRPRYSVTLRVDGGLPSVCGRW